MYDSPGAESPLSFPVGEVLMPAGDPRISALISRLASIKRRDDATQEKVENLPLTPSTTSAVEEKVIDPEFDI